MIVYDNEGKTFDRYTILVRPASGLLGRQELWEALGLSHDPDSPQGFSQWGLALPGPHLGKVILLRDLPKNVWLHVIKRLDLEEIE